jgi:hypothetical protein
MFSVLEKIAALILNASKLLQEQQDRNRRRTFGKALVTCYLRLLEVISMGEGIVDQFEFYFQGYDSDPDRQDYWEFCRKRLRVKLKNQSINLTRLIYELDSIVRELELIAPEMVEQLKRDISGKKRRIGNLLALEVLRASLASAELPGQISLHSDFDAEASSIIETESKWEKEMYETVRAYFVIDRPHETLNVLRNHAKEIRNLIVQNFKLEEILWSADHFDDGLRNQ